MNDQEKTDLLAYFHGDIYGLICARMDEMHQTQWPGNIIALVKSEDVVGGNDDGRIMSLKDVTLKKNELYKVTLPTKLHNLEQFVIVLAKTIEDKISLTIYENTLNSILIKSPVDIELTKLEVWNHQIGDIIQYRASA